MYAIKQIPINIWDDFYEDDFVPEGEKQETHIYVEDCDIPKVNQKEYLEVLLEYINKNLDTNGVILTIETVYEEWQIKVEGLTHAKLYEWMEVLGSADIKVDGIPFSIYSES